MRRRRRAVRSGDGPLLLLAFLLLFCEQHVEAHDFVPRHAASGQLPRPAETETVRGSRGRRSSAATDKQYAFGNAEYLLPENFKTLRRSDIPVTYRLHDDLLRYYRKGTRPVTHPDKIVSVSMSTFLYQIIKLDAVKNTISLSGSFELYWQDEFLQWDPDMYEGAREIFLSSEDIWIPEFSLYYSHNFNDVVKLRSDNDVRVNHTGHIRYYIPFSTESLCKLDVKFFPFDIQKCTLLFGSWAYSNDSIKYSLFNDSLSLIDFYDNQEWQLNETQSRISSAGFLYDYLDPPLFWEMIIMELVVHRQSFYFVFNLVIPSTIITIVAVIGFHTPSTSGRVRDAKFRLGIMTLMSMSVILLAIVEDMPKFSIDPVQKGKGSFSGIPLIGLYYFILLAIIGLSTVTTSAFVFLEKEIRKTHVMPWYLHWLTYDIALLHRRFHRLHGYSHPNAEPESTTSLLPNGHVSTGVRDKARGVANSILAILNRSPSTRRGDSNAHYGATNAAQVRLRCERSAPAQVMDSPRREPRRRLSIGQYDNMVVYQYFDQALDDLLRSINTIEKSVANIRTEVLGSLPKDDSSSQWQRAIRRLELMSLAFYLSVIFLTMILFFQHGWYCSIGFDPCAEPNLKCPAVHQSVIEQECTKNTWSTT